MEEQIIKVESKQESNQIVENLIWKKTTLNMLFDMFLVVAYMLVWYYPVAWTITSYAETKDLAYIILSVVYVSTLGKLRFSQSYSLETTITQLEENVEVAE